MFNQNPYSLFEINIKIPLIIQSFSFFPERASFLLHSSSFSLFRNPSKSSRSVILVCLAPSKVIKYYTKRGQKDQLPSNELQTIFNCYHSLTGNGAHLRKRREDWKIESTAKYVFNGAKSAIILSLKSLIDSAPQGTTNSKTIRSII
jgi:hypothetical protein